MKNIVIICYKYPPEYSGYGKQLESVISAMRERNSVNITLLTAFSSSKQKESKNLKVVPLGFQSSSKKSLIFYVFCLRALLWLSLHRKKYSLIHCIKAGPEALVGNIASKLFRKKIIVKVAQEELSTRELENINRFKWFARRFRQKCLRNADRFVAISEEIKDNIQKTLKVQESIVKIPNGVDVDKFHPVSEKRKNQIKEKLDLPSGSVIALFAGAINKRKGIEDLLEAVDMLENETKGIIVLCGPILENIQFEDRIAEINKLKTSTNIIYKGSVDNIEEYMQASDIFLLPSYSEGLPNVLLEANSSGLASIATDIGGNRDVVTDKYNGYLVPVKNANLLSEKLQKLIDEKDLREKMGKNARDLVCENFSLENVATKYLHLYQQLSDKKD
ncbi:glycosyltransferase family 4 protein [Marinococcus luteus]|uniref:glycosyltransferase family 4 protein n=1 Tax=Marinococcus luteus TaxID=1122204 RepID=UPI002ACCD970|nr:glycosyltransferase family 4 protein [Marinococcus luteus]MDZ5782820.1 glycosyltransferase family 4 protein [Marinococcus luteus]